MGQDSNEPKDSDLQETRSLIQQMYERVNAPLATFREDSVVEESHDEGWLVSYADMMTLLFGLFVLMFSLAQENKGDNLDQTVREISARASNPENTDTKKMAQAPKGEVIKSLEQRLESSQKESVSLKENIMAAQTEIELLKKENVEALAEKDRLEKELVKNREKNVSHSSEKNLEMSKLNEQVSIEKSNRLESLEGQLRQKQSEIRGLSEKLLQQAEKFEKKEKVLQAKLGTLTMELENLKKENPQRFMAVIAQWTTERQDVDLILKDPNSKVFNFKNRKYQGYPGELTMDSRFGPGVEVWQTNDFRPGVYTVTLQLYRSYGQSLDTPVKLSVISPMGRVDIPELVLNLNKKKAATVTFTLDGKGHLVEIGKPSN